MRSGQPIISHTKLTLTVRMSPKAVTVGKQEIPRKDVHARALLRMNSGLVLSETLDEKAVQVLIGVSIAEFSRSM